MSGLREYIQRQMLSAAQIVLGETDPKTGKVKAENWHVRYQYPLYLMAYLYRTEFPGNLHYGDPDVLDLSIRMAKCMMATRNEQGLYEGGSIGGGDYGFLEWPVYFLCRMVSVLGDALPQADRAEICGAIAQYVESALVKPFGFTSPNHEAWRFLDYLLASEVCGRPEWTDVARFSIHRLIATRRPEGFWEEGRHHGPSIAYNYVMLRPLYTFWRTCGDEIVREACVRLLDFMTSAAFPDGTGIAAFDGRQTYGIGTPSAMLQMTPGGRRLSQLLVDARTRHAADGADMPHYSSSNWNSHHSMAVAPDDALLLDDAPGDVEPLEQESRDYSFENHSQAFEAATRRVGPWFAAASGIVSNIPLFGSTPYRMERQNRIDVWHEKCGLLVGSGSTPITADVPLANIHVVTGYGGASCDFGMISGEQKRARQKVYFPEAATPKPEDDGVSLEMDFAQANVCVSARRVDDDRLRVSYDVESMHAKLLVVQLPVVVFDEATLTIDGKPARQGEEIAQPVTKGVRVDGTPMGGSFSVSVESPGPSAIRYPIGPMRSYRGLDRKERYRPLYGVALYSTQIDNPKRHTRVEFTITTD